MYVEAGLVWRQFLSDCGYVGWGDGCVILQEEHEAMMNRTCTFKTRWTKCEKSIDLFNKVSSAPVLPCYAIYDDHAFLVPGDSGF